jgi:hypothetical protein
MSSLICKTEKAQTSSDEATEHIERHLRLKMALVHQNSCECTKSELDLFGVPPTQTSVEHGYWEQIRRSLVLLSRSVLVPHHARQLRFFSRWSVTEKSFYVRPVGIHAALEKTSCKYPVRRVEVKVDTVPTGNTNYVQDNMFLRQLPKR